MNAVTERSVLDGTGYGWLAGFYRAFRGVLTPAEVDKSELWQLVVLAGNDMTSKRGGQIVLGDHDRAQARYQRLMAERAAAEAVSDG